MTEWRPIPSVKFYEASDDGRVRSIDRLRQTSNGQIRFYRGKEITPSSSNQYGHIKGAVAGKPRYFHRLIAEAFHGPCPDGMQVAHCDGNCKNNRPENLRYDTPTGNNSDKVAHETILKGENHPGAKLSQANVSHIRKLRLRLTQKAVAEIYGVTRSTIAAIDQGKSWL